MFKKKTVFGFDSAKYVINLSKASFSRFPVNEQNNEPNVLMKAHKHVPFKFGIFRLLENLNFRGGTTKIDSFLEA